jgi:hypothetical protein
MKQTNRRVFMMQVALGGSALAAQQAMAQADAAPWPEAQAAYTDIQTTGEGQWF